MEVEASASDGDGADKSAVGEEADESAMGAKELRRAPLRFAEAPTDVSGILLKAIIGDGREGLIHAPLR